MEIVVLRENPTLVNSTIPAGNYTDYTGALLSLSAWTSGTYAAGAKVYLNSSEPHTVWESLEGSNTDTPSLTSAKWSKLGVTDRYKMLDLYQNTQSQLTGSFEFEIDSSMCDMVGFFGLQAITLELELWVGGEAKKVETIDLHEAEEASWWSYFFSEHSYKKLYIWNFPNYASSTLKGTVSWKPGELAKCGTLAVGEVKYVGGTAYGPDITTKTTSVVAETLGITTFTKGYSAYIKDLEVYLPEKDITRVGDLLKSQDSKPIILNANNDGIDEDILKGYGFFRSFRTLWADKNDVRTSIKFEGMY